MKMSEDKYVDQWIEGIKNMVNLCDLSKSQKDYLKVTVYAEYYSKKITIKQRNKMLAYIDTL